MNISPKLLAKIDKWLLITYFGLKFRNDYHHVFSLKYFKHEVVSVESDIASK